MSRLRRAWHWLVFWLTGRLQVPDYSDLLGVPFVMGGRDIQRDGGLSCQGLLLEIYSRLGIEAPDPAQDADAGEYWDQVPGPPRPMDVLGLRTTPNEIAGHVAVYVGNGQVLHAARDVGVVLRDYKRLAHKVHAIYRWRRVRIHTQYQYPPGTGLVLRTKDSPLGRYACERHAITSGMTLWDAVPQRIRDMDQVLVELNGERIRVADLQREAREGDVLSIVPISGLAGLVVGAAVSLVLGILLKVAEFQINQHTKKRARKTLRHAAGGASYAFDIMQNETTPGAPIPAVLGRHRVGGIVCQQFTRRHEEGVDKLNTLLAVSQGPVSSITDVHVDGNDISSYGEATFETRLGTNGQTAMRSIPDTSTTTVLNNQLLNGTPVVIAGVATSDEALYKITMLTGQYQIDNNGHPEEHRFEYRTRFRPSGGAWSSYNLVGKVNVDSNVGTARVYIQQYQGLKVGGSFHETPDRPTYICIGQGTAREEFARVSNVGVDSSNREFVDVAAVLLFSHTAAQNDEVVLSSIASPFSGSDFSFRRRRTSAFPIYHEFHWPSNGTYDVEFERRSRDHNGTDVFSDAWLKQQEEITNVGQTMPRIAMLAVSAIANDQLSGQVQRITSLVEGILCQTMASASTFGAAAWTRNPAELLLGVFYNVEWGAGKRLDRWIELTVAGGAGDYTVGEKITGPASEYQFFGEVISWTASTLKLVVNSLQGLPHGLLTGADSGAARTVASIDDAHAIDLAKLWAFRNTWCEAYVSDLSANWTTVGADSASGAAILYVVDPTKFAVDNYIIIDPDGAKEEVGQVDLVHADHVHLKSNLTYTHTLVEAAEVHRAEKRCMLDYVLADPESAMEFAQRVAHTAQAEAWEQDGRICVRAYQLETPCEMVTEGNTVFEGSDSLVQQTDAPGLRPNRLTIYYTDETLDYSETPLTLPDKAAEAASEDQVADELEEYGACRRSQVTRNAYWRLKHLRYSGGKLISFRMGIQAMNFEVLDVIYVGSQITRDGYGNGSVESAGAGYVVLDHPCTIPAGTILIYVRHQDGTIENQQISSAVGTHKRFTISGAWTQTPARGDVYILGTPGRYRVLEIEAEPDWRCRITCERDDPALYVYNLDEVPDFDIDELPDPHEIPPDVENLTANAENAVRVGGQVDYQLAVGWTKPTHNANSQAEVWYRELAGQIWCKGKTGWASGSGNGEFDLPRGCSANSTHVFIADRQNYSVVKLDRFTGAFVARYGAYGTGNGQLLEPTDVYATETHIFITDRGRNDVQKWTVNGVYAAKLGSSGSGADQFDKPNAVSGSGAFVVVADTFNSRIVKIDDGLVGSGGGTWTAFGTQGAGNDQFDHPRGLDCNATYVAVADTINHRLKLHLFSDLSYVRKVGSYGWGTGATDDQFAYPEDVAIDSSSSHVWGADTWNQRIHRRLLSDLSLDEMIGETGVWGTGREQFRYPSGLAWYGGRLYVVETANHRVQERTDDEGTGQGGWTLWERTPDQESRITGLVYGETYEVAVVSVSPFNARKAAGDAPSVTEYMPRRNVAPPNVTGLAASAYAGRLLLSWARVVCEDLADYEVRAGASFAAAQRVGVIPAGVTVAYVEPPAAGQTSTLWVRARTTSDVYSATPASVGYTTPQPPQMPSWPTGGSFSDNWRL